MRILIHGLQSSGASFFTFLLGQTPQSAVILDLYNQVLMPELKGIDDNIDLIGKCVIGSEYQIEEHKRTFKPDKTILFLRHPIHNYQSLANKDYSNENGTITEKFQVANQLLLNWTQYFDLLVHYEDIFFKTESLIQTLNKEGIPFHKSYFKMERDLETVINFTRNQSEWLNQYYNVKWGPGNLTPKNTNLVHKVFKPYSPITSLKLKAISPQLFAHYSQYKVGAYWPWYKVLFKSWYHHSKLALYNVKESIKNLLN